MQLEDGRFLVASDRYDKLLQEHSREELDELKLVRVDERFRVIALGLPVPRYQGNPLDPPLRSRFQARDVNQLPFNEELELLQESAPNVKSDRLTKMLMFASTMVSKESTSLGLPDFPVSNLHDLAKILDVMPETSLHSLIQRLYPYNVMMGKEGQTAVTDALAKFDIPTSKVEQSNLVSVERLKEGTNVSLKTGRNTHSFENELPSDWPVTIIMSGGQPMTKSIVSCVGKCCKFFLCMYGSTEVVCLAKNLVTDPESFTEYSCGKPIQYPGLEIKIVNDDGKIVPVNERGEIYCRSPVMFKEYFNDPVKTKAFKSDDGWFRTDDIGRLTECGELFVEGRKSNMILSGGFNVAPEILEQVMKNFPGVEGVVIVPVPDDIYFQVLCACVVKKAGNDVTEKELRKVCSNYHADKPGLFTVLPKFYLFFETFPETSTGKLNRRELEKIATQRFKSTL